MAAGSQTAFFDQPKAQAEIWQLRQKQSLPLDAKVAMAENRIREWYDHWEGQVYVSYSAGKDSAVLLHLVRNLYPRVPAVFIDSMEWPESRQLARATPGIVWIRPAMTFRQVIEQYGYPVVSKEQSQYIRELRQWRDRPESKMYQLRVHGNRWGRGRVVKRWRFLLDAPFEISERCCHAMRKRPMAGYERETGRKAYLGILAEESNQRTQQYLRFGCNAYGLQRPASRPLMAWTEADVWEYLRSRSVPYSHVYNLGYTRTGCMFCMFGIHLEELPNRFQRMARTHPKHYAYCMDRLGLARVLEYMGIPYQDKPPTDENQLRLWPEPEEQPCLICTV